MTERVALTIAEIKTAQIFIDQYMAAAVSLKIAQQQEDEFFEIMRAKYELGPEWVCNDILLGFERVEAGDDGNEDNQRADGNN